MPHSRESAVRIGPGDFVAGHRAVFLAAGLAVRGRIESVSRSGKSVVFAPLEHEGMLLGLPRRVTFTWRPKARSWAQKCFPARRRSDLCLLRDRSR